MNYLLESSLFLSVSCLVYLIARRWISIRERRIFLLSTVLCSMLVPLINVSIPVSQSILIPTIEISNYSRSLSSPEVEIVGSNRPEQSKQIKSPREEEAPYLDKDSSSSWDLYSFVVFFYWIGFGVGFIRFLFSLWGVYSLYKKSELIKFKESRVYQVSKKNFAGASFFKLIFIEHSLDDTTREVVYHHENSHVELLHAFDLVLSQLLIITFWFHPFSWLIHKELKLLAECEADSNTIIKVGRDEYLQTLIQLNTHKPQKGILNAFGLQSMKYRVTRLNSFSSEPSLSYKGLIAVMSLSLLLFVFSCEQEVVDVLGGKQIRDVKSITTTFVSHQVDTKQKDGQIVSLATFFSDGTLESVQHQTSYPYDRKTPSKDARLLFQPIPENIHFIMDGLSMGGLENNLLFGDDWPIDYAKVDASQNPFIWSRLENQELSKEVKYSEAEFPSELIHSVNQNGFKAVVSFDSDEESEVQVYDGYEIKEKFNQKDQKVTYYKRTYTSMYPFNGKVRKAEQEHLQQEFHYSYDEAGKLESINDGRGREYKITYSDKEISKIEYFINGQLYNKRLLYFADSGLKSKTEIFNLDEELEYTINYQYEFW